MSYQQKRAYQGELAQTFSLKEYVYAGGKAEGVRAADVANNAGVELTVLAGRCMDFGAFRYRGRGLNFFTPAGVVNSQFYDNRGEEFLRSFAGGFLTTCGLTEIGSGGECDGEQLGLHGRIGNTPAEQFGAAIEWESGEPRAVLSGVMRQARLFGENLRLHRRIVMGYDQKGFSFTDTVENIGFTTQPFMLLYHFNLGYPLVDEQAEIFLPASGTAPRNDRAAEGLDRWNRLQAPSPGWEEMCYLHTLKADKRGRSAAALYNHGLELGVVIRFDRALLDHFVEWKSMAAGNYVVGLEPTNGFVDGRAAAKAIGDLKVLQPGDRFAYDFTVEVLDSRAELDALLAEYQAMR